MRSTKSAKLQRNRAFSLVEVMVTASILIIITSVVMIRYSSFNSTILLRSQAYEMALNLREAQVFSISVRGETSSFRDVYGMYFTTATPNQYLLFIDGNANGYYDDGEVVVQAFIIDTRFGIGDIRVGSECTTSVEDVSITFQRPDFDAYMWSEEIGNTVAGACVDVTPATAGADGVRTVSVNAAGQIAIE